jgi:hypothetical protein
MFSSVSGFAVSATIANMHRVHGKVGGD